MSGHPTSTGLNSITVTAMDTGIHAGMTAFSAYRDLPITLSGDHGKDQNRAVACLAGFRGAKPPLLRD